MHQPPFWAAICWPLGAFCCLSYVYASLSINNQTYSDHLQAEEDYWRAKFEILLGCITHDDLELLVSNKVHPAMILVIAEIATWPNQESDKSQQDNDFLIWCSGQAEQRGKTRSMTDSFGNTTLNEPRLINTYSGARSIFDRS